METFESEEDAIRRRVAHDVGCVFTFELGRVLRDRELLLAEVDRLEAEADAEIDRLIEVGEEKLAIRKGDEGFWT